MYAAALSLTAEHVVKTQPGRLMGRAEKAAIGRGSQGEQGKEITKFLKEPKETRAMLCHFIVFY